MRRMRFENNRYVRAYRDFFTCNLLFICAIFCNVFVENFAASRPHIVFIMVDDAGWNDFSFHGSDQIITPNIDALAYNGLILNNLYTQPVCTPSRAALMTGKYPIHLGMQGAPILAAEPVGLPLTERTMADYLRDLGYTTRAVGKWHLGFYRREYTPRFRGFNSFFGYYGGFIGYYDHILQDVYENIGDFAGYDLRRDEASAWQEAEGVYATDLFTNEAVNIINNHNAEEPLFLYFAHLAAHAGNTGKLLEAPEDEIRKFQHIIDPNRRTYAAMISKIDESVGDLVEALENKKMLKDTIIVFMSDNGAPSVRNGTPTTREFPNWGSNFPFRGTKGTLWEGGVRSPSFIWSAALQQNPRVSTNLMHVSDWLPTLYAAAGGNPLDLPNNLDGVNHWFTLTLNLPSRPRSTVLINIDERNRNAATRVENWKLIIGTTLNGQFDGYYGDSWDIFDGYRTTYNITAVIGSKSGKAVSGIANELFLPVANEIDMQNRRSQATIRCDSASLWPTGTTGNVLSCQVTPCLFNIDNDPCERNNVARQFPSITTQLYDILKFHRLSLVPQINQAVDAFSANPKLFNSTWSTWRT
ncbi:arylsulfatase B-like [Planococcus citri]|uniref:arylsulfatase B-like n=1 Tax=Planococcus citri TaxID=170843 RepID=UPI0031F91EF0